MSVLTRVDVVRRIRRMQDPFWRDVAASAAHSRWGQASKGDVTIKPMVEYQKDPVGFAVQELGIPEHTLRWSLNPGYDTHHWDGTVDPIARMMEELAAGNDVGVESGTGTGKTFGAAVTLLWFLACFEDARVFSLAPQEEQLLLHMWKEVAALWPRFQQLKVARAAELHVGHLRMRGGIDDSWLAVARTAGVRVDEATSSRARGAHAEHMLFLLEEYTGIPIPVCEAVENTCTAEHNLRLALGNPDHMLDPLHRFCTAPGVVHIRASELDHPNIVSKQQVIPAAISQKTIDRRAEKYGEDGRLYLAMVRGISPEQAADALIRMAWLKRAASHYNDPAFRVGRPALGVDVANSESGDKGAIAEGIGRCCINIAAFQCPDANLLGVRVALLMALGGISQRNVGVDTVGVGAGTFNKLKEMGRFVRSLNGGAKAYPTADLERAEETGVMILPEEQFENLRGQMYWQARIDLQYDRIAVPDDPELFEELVIVTYEPKNKVISVLNKKAVIDILGHSPDKSDAFVYWNFVRPRHPAPVEEAQIRAFDPKVMAAHADAQLRVHDTIPKPKVDPMVMVEVD